MSTEVVDVAQPPLRQPPPVTTVQHFASVCAILAFILGGVWFIAQQYSAIETKQAVVDLRLDRLEKDFSEFRNEQKAQGKQVEAVQQMWEKALKGK